MNSKVVPITELSRGWVFSHGLINKEIAGVIEGLLNCLPDNLHHEGDQSWGFCWDELSDVAQEEVIVARDLAEGVLYAPRGDDDE